MKTMKKGKTIVRITEEEVKDYLKQGFEFCPKSEWKKQGEKNKNG